MKEIYRPIHRFVFDGVPGEPIHQERLQYMLGVQINSVYTVHRKYVHERVETAKMSIDYRAYPNISGTHRAIWC
jgi:hypothetical protein